MTPAPSPLPPQPHPGRSNPADSAVGASAAVQSTDLFKGQKSVVIEHNGASYRLQTTKLGKLILTK